MLTRRCYSFEFPKGSFGQKSTNMKKYFLLPACIMLIALGAAAQKEGKVIYERTAQMQIRMNDMPAGMEHQMPRTRTDKFELTFGNNQSLWKQAEPDADDDGGSFTSDNGAQVRMIVAGNDDVLYNDFGSGKRVEKREMFDKTFIINDTIAKLKWKMTGETKTILNYPCMKATATRISTRMMTNMENGKMERKEVPDTANIVAWFTTSIPVSAGPAEYQGQLPGLILEMDINNGRYSYIAKSFSEKADLASIKMPSGKKQYTPEEFRKERDKMMEEMNRNNQGGQRIIRMN